MVQMADAGGKRPVNPAAATISAAANTPAPQPPAKEATEAPAKARMASDSFEGLPETVTIKSGDSLGKLVAKYQISYEKLKELNPDIFKEGTDAKGRKRASDGHWVYPGDVIRLRQPASSSAPAAAATSSGTNNKVVEAAKAAIDEAKLTPATWAKGREMSEKALANAKEMLKLIPQSDPAREQYAEKVARLEREIQAVYPGASVSTPDEVTSGDALEHFEAASNGFNDASDAYYQAEEGSAARTEAREKAIRYFSQANDAARALDSQDAREEAGERLEMMEYTLTDMGLNSSAIALARGQGSDAPSAAAPKERSFAERDANQDGYLSGNELDDQARAYDTDGNQRVTREEWEMGQMAEREVAWKAEFKQADVNQDGWLSGNEAAQFRAYDADGDLEVTEEEFLAAKRAEVMNGVYEQDFAARDQNQDGYLSGNELDASARAYDTNMDGKVTREEYMAAKAGGMQPGMTATPVGTVPGAFPAPGVQQPQPMPPANPIEAFEGASARFNDAAMRNDVLAMTTAYQDAAYAIAYMQPGADRDTLAAQLEIMGYTLQQAYAATGTPVAAGGMITGTSAQPINAGIQPPAMAGMPGQPAYPGMPAAQGQVLYPSAAVAAPGAYPAAYPPNGAMVGQAMYPGMTYPAAAYPAGYPMANAQMMTPAVMPPAAAQQPAPVVRSEPPRQTYTEVWSSPEYLDEIMGYNATPPAGANGNMSAQGATPGTDAAQGNSNASGNSSGMKPVNEQAIREIDAFLERSNANAVRDMLASRPELLYDSAPRQKAQMIQLLLEGRTDGGDRQAIINILDMASQTEEVDHVLSELDSRYGGAGKGIKRMLEDLDQPSKARALKALFTPSLMQYRQYDQAAFEALVGVMTKDEIKLLMETMGFGVSSPWMSVLSPQARQSMITKLKSGFNLFGLFGGAEKQMVAALEHAAATYSPQIQ